jgi:hypothetical protein
MVMLAEFAPPLEHEEDLSRKAERAAHADGPAFLKWTALVERCG